MNKPTQTHSLMEIFKSLLIKLNLKYHTLHYNIHSL